jgi:uroporphyrin-3 C-methyltransferase
MEEPRDKIEDPHADSPGGESARNRENGTVPGKQQDDTRLDAARTRSPGSSVSNGTDASTARPVIAATKPGAASQTTSKKPPPDKPERKAEPPATKQRRSGSWIAVLLALGAVAASGYALFRLQTAGDAMVRLQQDIDALRGELGATADTRTELQREMQQLTAAQQSVNETLRGRIDTLQSLPDEVAGLRRAVAEARRQGNGAPQSAALVEARTLLEMAQHRLAIDRDVTAATTALETADRVLGELEEPGLAAVRDRIARDLSALRAVPQPDRTALANRLVDAERRVATLPLAVPAPGEPAAAAQTTTPDSGPARAWAMIQQAFSNLISVRRSGDADALVSADLAAIRRQHLELLLLAANASLLRADQAAYESSLAQATTWLDRHFATDAESVAAMRDELEALGQIDVAPALPDISGAAQLLADLPMPAGESE